MPLSRAAGEGQKQQRPRAAGSHGAHRVGFRRRGHGPSLARSRLHANPIAGARSTVSCRSLGAPPCSWGVRGHRGRRCCDPLRSRRRVRCGSRATTAVSGRSPTMPRRGTVPTRTIAGWKPLGCDGFQKLQSVVPRRTHTSLDRPSAQETIWSRAQSATLSPFRPE